MGDGEHWDSTLSLKGQVNEMKFIEQSMVKPGLNLRKKCQEMSRR